MLRPDRLERLLDLRIDDQIAFREAGFYARPGARERPERAKESAAPSPPRRPMDAQEERVQRMAAALGGELVGARRRRGPRPPSPEQIQAMREAFARELARGPVRPAGRRGRRSANGEDAAGWGAASRTEGRQTPKRGAPRRIWDDEDA